MIQCSVIQHTIMKCNIIYIYIYIYTYIYTYACIYIYIYIYIHLLEHVETSRMSVYLSDTGSITYYAIA